MEWRLQGIRVVLYTTPAALPDAEEVWKKILSPRLPENVQRPKGMGMPQSMASGSVRGNQLSVTIQPSRIDLIVSPETNNWADENIDGPSLDDLLKPSVVYGQKIIEMCSGTRAALVTDAFKHASSYSDAQRMFQEELDFVPHLNDVRDINFQVNPSKPFSNWPNQKMFRLCRWSTASMQLFNMQIAGGHFGSTLSPATGPIEQKHILSFQTDLSGEPLAGAPLDSGTLKDMLREMGDETGKLLLNGFEGLRQ